MPDADRSEDARLQARRSLLFATRLASVSAPAAVADIFKRTRERHEQLAIEGVMLFDGEHLGHWLVGRAQALRVALDEVRADRLQSGLRQVFEGDIPPGWTPHGWRVGWTEPDALADLFAEDAAASTDRVLAGWHRLMLAGDLL
jgi:hypothetical protein